ncbi:hypothetical protein [Cronobacter dublinensis]|uniref:hypothetical protein n=1 Tax=Cronobacter dublinensis TaxID=413497 RepID=UPI00300E0E47
MKLIQFNIIYIMRTKVDSGGIWRNAVVIALVAERCGAIISRYMVLGFSTRVHIARVPDGFQFFAQAVKTGYRTASVKR